MFDWIVTTVEQTGYIGIMLLMLAENVFPPIPSEVIMPLAGFAAARGDLDIGAVVLAGTAGSLSGTLFWYWMARRVGGGRLRAWTQRHGHWLTLAPDDLDRANGWFRRHSGSAVFFGRLVPAVRTLVSVPAGVSDMPLGRFVMLSAAGTSLWTAGLTLGGYLLEGGYEAVSAWINPISNAVVAGLALWYLWRVWSQWRSAAE